MSLIEGRKVKYGTEIYRVGLVNECRARLDPVAKTRCVIVDKAWAEQGVKRVRTFEARGRSLNVSPNSPLEYVS